MPEDRGQVYGTLVALGALVGVAALAARYRSWHLTWGATKGEVSGPMPGDDLLDGARFIATRAIFSSTQAPPPPLPSLFLRDFLLLHYDLSNPINV